MLRLFAAGCFFGGDFVDYLKYIVEEIHSTVIATTDDKGLPVTCAIDIMDYDDNSLYFLTARGKNFYKRLKNRNYLALTGMKGSDTMSCVAVSVRGRVRELGSELVPRLFEKNKYMFEIYPNKKSQEALTVFQIYEGSGEWFDLSVKPIERASFSFGNTENVQRGYFINQNCTGCGLCTEKCPTKCIDLSKILAKINQKNCLHCGNCLSVCPFNAVYNV